MSTVISVENVSKMYRLGEVGTGTLSHDLNRWWHKVRGKDDPYLKIGESNDRASKGDSEYVYALRDINFEVKQGEVLGIIGKNGAGKSTLLKLLSRVTSPTSGKIKIKGRTASLLEVGTGFHPELTGRENIFLNGAILGMTKAEIRAKFDEIVDFSGVERYIDTPVKRYSSGMYVRLAFAVAAHLDPEILIVDEVLAVGDAEFQKKCLGKMGDISKNEGRTILFVSHQLGMINNLCPYSMLLRSGNVVLIDKTNLIIDEYLSSQKTNKVFFESIECDSKINYFKFVSLQKESADNCNSFSLEEEIKIMFRIHITRLTFNLKLTYSVNHRDNFKIFSSEINLFDFLGNKKNSNFDIVSTIKKRLLVPGTYSLSFGIHVPNVEVFDIHQNALSFEVIDSGSEYSVYGGSNHGVIFINNEWHEI